MHLLRVAAVVLGVGSVVAEDCSVPGACAAGDEGSLLALGRGRIQTLLRDAGETVSIEKNNASMMEAAQFVGYLIAYPYKNSSAAWSVAMAPLITCIANTTAAGSDAYTCEPPREQLMTALEAVPKKYGYNCTATEILHTAARLKFTKATWFAGEYPVQYTDQDKTSTLILYTNSSGLYVTLDNVYVKKPIWAANCSAQMDPLCMQSPNVLSWKASDGNPTSGRLRFAVASNFSGVPLPPTAYEGPLFIGSIASGDEVPAGHNVKGAMFQNADVLCGGKATGSFVSESAPLGCLSGLYCTRAWYSNTSQLAAALSNITIGPDFVQLAGKKITTYRFVSNTLSFVSSESQPWSGSLVLRKGEALPQLSGALWKASEVGFYNFTGYAPANASSCELAPAQLNMDWWTNQKTWEQWAEALGVVAFSALAVTAVKNFDAISAEIMRWFGAGRRAAAQRAAELAEVHGEPERVDPETRYADEIARMEQQIADNRARLDAVTQEFNRNLAEGRGTANIAEDLRLMSTLRENGNLMEERLAQVRRGDALPVVSEPAMQADLDILELARNPLQSSPERIQAQEVSDVLLRDRFSAVQEENRLAAEEAEVASHEERLQEVIDDPHAPEPLREQAQAEIALVEDRAEVIEASRSAWDAQMDVIIEAEEELEDEMSEVEEQEVRDREAEAAREQDAIDRAQAEGEGAGEQAVAEEIIRIP